MNYCVKEWKLDKKLLNRSLQNAIENFEAFDGLSGVWRDLLTRVT